MPLFGMDIGGTLTKLVYFEPSDFNEFEEEERKTLQTIHRYLMGQTAYGQSGIRDVHLELENQTIGGRTGRIHFIRFPTAQMSSFTELAKMKRFTGLASGICATGGGAYKFEDFFKNVGHMGWRGEGKGKLKLGVVFDTSSLRRNICSNHRYIFRMSPAG